MKNAKRPKRDQKKLIEASGKDWREYLVAGEDNLSLTIIRKDTGKREVLMK